MPFLLRLSVALFLLSFPLMALDLADLKGYSQLQVLLAADKLEETRTEAKNLLQQSKIKSPSTSFLEKISKSSDELDLRKAFGEMSEFWVEKVKKEKPLQADWQLFFCPMTPKGVYGFWIQPKNTELKNPYYGAKMLTCGVKRSW